MSSPFKVSGPEVSYVYVGVRCCRIWPVVTATLTWDPRNEMMKRESWWWRNCGLCNTYPRPVDEGAIEGDLMR